MALLRVIGKRSCGQKHPFLAVHVFCGCPFRPWTRTMSTVARGSSYTQVISKRFIWSRGVLVPWTWMSAVSPTVPCSGECHVRSRTSVYEMMWLKDAGVRGERTRITYHTCSLLLDTMQYSIYGFEISRVAMLYIRRFEDPSNDSVQVQTDESRTWRALLLMPRRELAVVCYVSALARERSEQAGERVTLSSPTSGYRCTKFRPRELSPDSSDRRTCTRPREAVSR